MQGLKGFAFVSLLSTAVCGADLVVASVGSEAAEMSRPTPDAGAAGRMEGSEVRPLAIERTTRRQPGRGKAGSKRHKAGKAVIMSESPSPEAPSLSARQAVLDHAQLLHAYDAFRAGDLVLARQRYERILEQDPLNTHALDALAIIAFGQGQTAQAERHLRQSVSANPKNTAALAKLILLNDPGEESLARLQTVLTTHPPSAPAHFALGRRYAELGRWADAQEAFFKAHALDPESPDALFNLAVSLDHLRQPAAAREMYLRAAMAAAHRPAAFDRAVSRQRAEQLAKVASP